MAWVDRAKRAAVVKALEEVGDAQTIGIGSGSTIEILVHELAKRIGSRAFELRLIPTSIQIEAAILKAGLRPVNPNEVSEIELALDGADQVTPGSLDLIKGGGGALTREKIIDTAAREFVVVVDERKLTQTLGTAQSVPVEVIPFARRLVMAGIRRLGGKPALKCGTNSIPFVTDNGNYVIDADFGPIQDPCRLEAQLKSMPGLVETGLFLGLTDRVYVGHKDGNVTVLEPT